MEKQEIKVMDMSSKLPKEISDALENALFGHTSGMTRFVEPVEGKVMIDYDQYQELVVTDDAKLLNEDVVICPTYMTEKAVGADCFASEEVIIPPWTVKAIMTGVKAKFPGNELGLFASIRSSIPKKKGLILANGLGVIEEDYYGNPDNDGNIGFLLLNITSEPVKVERFERIGQIFLANIDRFENAGKAGVARGASGSTSK